MPFPSDNGYRNVEKALQPLLVCFGIERRRAQHISYVFCRHLIASSGCLNQSESSSYGDITASPETFIFFQVRNFGSI